MKLTTIFATLSCSVLLSSQAFAESAHQHSDKAGEECHHPNDAQAGIKDITSRGEPLTAEVLKGKPVVAIKEVIEKADAYVGKTVVTTGVIRQVCQKKGCWMEVGASDKGPGARVTFKDYGFFAPKDAVGQLAKVVGVVKISLLTEDRAKHYEAEGATIARDASGKPREVNLEVSGMELSKAPAKTKG